MAELGEKKTENPEEETSKCQNHGKLILDATCAPGDIKYPTDIEILNDARIQTILDFRFWILDFRLTPYRRCWGLSKKFWILDYGKVPQINLGADRILDFGLVMS